MNLTVYTPKQKLFEKMEAKSVYIPGTSGDMQILENHIPVITSLRSGKIVIETKDSKKVEILATQGYIQFSDNKMIIVIEKTDLTETELENLIEQAKELKKTEIKQEEKITEKEFYETKTNEI